MLPPGFPPRKPGSLILGKIISPGFHLRRRYLTVSLQERSTHAFVVGKTGRGKSKFLLHAILSDIEAGRGTAVCDPHGDLCQEISAYLYQKGWFDQPSHRDKFVYIDPTNRTHPTPMNILATSDHPTGEEISARASEVIVILKRAWRDNLSAAPNFEDVARNALTLLVKTRRTLLDFPRLFIPDTTFRDHLLDQARDVRLSEFFCQRMDGLGKAAAERKESSTNKISPWRLIPYIERTIGQPDNWLHFRKWMDESYVVLVNLGRLEPDSEEERFFGNIITRGFEQAAFSREDLPLRQRQPFFLYVDEAHNFSSVSGRAFASMMSGTRKFGLFLTLVSQYLGQVEEAGLLEAIFGNVGTLVFFGLSPLDALKIAPAIHLGDLDIDQIKEEAKTDHQHNVYEPVSNQEKTLARDMANRPRRWATVRNDFGQVFTIETMPLPDVDPLPPALFAQVVRPYGLPAHRVQAHLDSLYSRDDGLSAPAHTPWFSS